MRIHASNAIDLLSINHPLFQQRSDISRLIANFELSVNRSDGVQFELVVLDLGSVESLEVIQVTIYPSVYCDCSAMRAQLIYKLSELFRSYDLRFTLAILP